MRPVVDIGPTSLVERERLVELFGSIHGRLVLGYGFKRLASSIVLGEFDGQEQIVPYYMNEGVCCQICQRGDCSEESELKP